MAKSVFSYCAPLVQMVENLAPDISLAYSWYEQRILAPGTSFPSVRRLLRLLSVATVNEKSYHRLRVFHFSSLEHR